MASISKTPAGTWRARYRDGNGREHAKVFRRKVDGQQWLDQTTTAVQTGNYVSPALGKVTLGVFGPQYLDAQAHLKASTATRYRSLWVQHIAPTWAAVRLCDVSYADVVAWISLLQRKGLSGSSVRQAHRVLSMVLDLAVKDGRMPRNHAHGVKLPRAAKPAKRFLTHRQVAELADAAGPGRLPILLLAYTGLRWGEVAALRVGSVDLLLRRLQLSEATTELGGHLVSGTPKNHQARSVPLAGLLIDALAQAMAGKSKTDLVFTAPEGGQLRLSNFRSRIFDPAVKAAGLDGITPKSLRDAAASLAVSSGANVKVVQRMLGHASAAMTLDVYSGLFDDDLDGVADRMSAAALAADLRPIASVTALPSMAATL